MIWSETDTALRDASARTRLDLHGSTPSATSARTRARSEISNAGETGAPTRALTPAPTHARTLSSHHAQRDGRTPTPTSARASRSATHNNSETGARVMPRYPVYVPSKGRADLTRCTARYLAAAGVDYHLVVEPTEAEAYARVYGRDRLLVLPFHDLGQGSIPARNWIWEHARARGAARYWCIDDNIDQGFMRRHHAKRIPCAANIALAVAEDFADRYENVAICGLNYEFNVPDDRRILPVQVNCHVYSCMLIWTALEQRWRGRYNEDTDLCLQVLSTGEWCTVLLNTFLARKARTMTVKGGNSTQLYQGDGRLAMARSLERAWPGVVRVDRRFQRPQHKVAYEWKRFDTPLRLKPGISLDALRAAGPNEYGMTLAQVAPQVRSPRRCARPACARSLTTGR